MTSHCSYDVTVAAVAVATSAAEYSANGKRRRRDRGRGLVAKPLVKTTNKNMPFVGDTTGNNFADNKVGQTVDMASHWLAMRHIGYMWCIDP